MNRRTALIWITRLLAAACAAVVAVPGARFVVATVTRKKQGGAILANVARLNDLTPGQPFDAPIYAIWQDAWIQNPEQAIGRVWLVRRTGPETPPDKTQVDAYSSVCPHMGCSVGWVPGDKRFFCPCHKGAFEITGEPMSKEKLGAANPVPRALDQLETKLVKVESDKEPAWWVQVKYEQFVQGPATKIVKG